MLRGVTAGRYEALLFERSEVPFVLRRSEPVHLRMKTAIYVVILVSSPCNSLIRCYVIATRLLISALRTQRPGMSCTRLTPASTWQEVPVHFHREAWVDARKGM